MRISRARMLWTAIGLTAAAMLALVLRPTPVAVEVAAVVRGPLEVTVDEEGMTRLGRRYVVASPVAGTVRRIDLRPGGLVARGGIVAVIDPAPATPIDARTRATAEARVRAADAVADRVRAERQRAIIERDRAVADASRAKSLFDAGYGSRESADATAAAALAATQAVEAAESAVHAAEFGAVEARAILAPANAARRGTPIAVHAPIDGVVLRRLHESEAVVQAGTPLVEIGNLQDLEIVSDLLTTDAVKVQPGAGVRIDGWGGDADLSGTVIRVEPSGFVKVSALGVEEQRVNVIIGLDAPPDVPVPLGDNFRVWVHIAIWEQLEIVKIPTSAIFRRDGQWTAFVLAGGRIADRSLTLGQRNGQEAQVIAGVTEGELVVLYPGDSLTTGGRAVAKRR